jgi:hypothetical protein
MSPFTAALIVTIRVYDIYGVAPDTRQGALAVATEALARAGVQAAWIDCSAKVAATPCKLPLADGELVLRIHRLPPDGQKVLGDAVLPQGQGRAQLATIYAAAVADTAVRSGTPMAMLLGRATAHEIGHLLLGRSGHADAGLMRAKWSWQDLQRAARHADDWDFSRAEAATMRLRLADRQALRVRPEVGAATLGGEAPAGQGARSAHAGSM